MLHNHLTTSSSSSSSSSSSIANGTADTNRASYPQQQLQQQVTEISTNRSQSVAVSGDSDGDAPANSGIANPADLCAAFSGLQHHPWTDDLLLQLQQYERAGHLVPSTAAAAATNQAGGEVTEQQQQQSGSQEEASRLALQLLQDAVNTRCWTINTLQTQHSDHHQQQQQCLQLQPTALLSQQLQQVALNSAQQLQVPDTPTAAAAAAVPADLQSLLAPAPILILFSGGVDSTLIAALAHLALPLDVPIDLSNVCFVGGASPDRLAAHSALLELAAFAPQRQWRLIEVNSSLAEVPVVMFDQADVGFSM
jgi:hypothetical protein